MESSDHDRPRPSAARRAKLFWSGGSQAVRLAKEFRFEGDEVEIRREGEAVVLEPARRRVLPGDYWQRIDRLRAEMEFPDVEPLGVDLHRGKLNEE